MYTAHNTKKEGSYIALGKLAAIVLFMVALFLIVLFVLPERSAAAGNSTCTYTITSVQICEGDSLWSLASRYYTEEYSSITEYIAEIKRMNGLSSDVLYAGNYLLIPHFVSE